MKKIFILGSVVVILFIIFFLNTNKVDEVPTVAPTPETITFSKTGVFVMNNPGMEKDVPFLIYEEPGKPAISAKLKFDEKSICSSGSGTLPCMAMSMTFDLAFGGKRVLVEGIDGEDDFIIIRDIKIQE